jgi:hypothetical protein
MAKRLCVMPGELVIGDTAVIGGPAAIATLLNDYARARAGTPMLLGLGLAQDIGYLVLVRVGDGPMVGMLASQARAASAYCLATELMPPEFRLTLVEHLADLARHLTDLAEQAEALQPQRLH